MKKLRILGLLTISLTLLVGGASAQKKTTKHTTSTKKPAPATATVPPLDVRAAREKVDAQLANTTQFIDVLGPVAQAIETLDQSKNLPKASFEKNEANKQKVIAAIRNLKAGLTTLESDFRTKTVLQKYLPNIQGITDLASQSEDLAIAGKFVAAKDPLRDVAKKLTDTLQILPR